MKKVSTKNYGVRNILEIQGIDGTDELFIAEISYGRLRRHGIIDDQFCEVVPFGEMSEIIGTRVITDSIVIIDMQTMTACCETGGIDEYGSLLLVKRDGKFKLEYTSYATIMQVTNDMLYGADYVLDDGDHSFQRIYYMNFEDTSYPIRTYEYNYRKDYLVHQEDFKEKNDSELAKYFFSKILPYPDKIKNR